MRDVMIIKHITKMFGVDAGIRAAKLLFSWDGGEGSGNFGHKGRPGQVGGSGGGGSGEHAPKMSASPEYQKKLDDSLAKFKNDSHGHRMVTLVNNKILPFYMMNKDRKWIDEDTMWRDHIRNAGYDIPDDMSFEDACDYAMEKYTVMEKYTNAHGERKYPEKTNEGQHDYLRTPEQRLKAVQYFTGVDKEEAQKMLEGLENHCGDAFADSEWVDKYIDANGRYEGAIYRWKGYTGKEAEEKLSQLFPGAKMENKYDSNWSFSSDPFATSVFGSLRQADYTTFCYVCDRNITGSPIGQYSVYEDEYEVVAHSKSTYTVQSIVEKEHEGHKYYEVHISEDDWQAERDLKPYDPPRESEKHDNKYDYWEL